MSTKLLAIGLWNFSTPQVQYVAIVEAVGTVWVYAGEPTTDDLSLLDNVTQVIDERDMKIKPVKLADNGGHSEFSDIPAPEIDDFRILLGDGSVLVFNADGNCYEQTPEDDRFPIIPLPLGDFEVIFVDGDQCVGTALHVTVQRTRSDN